METKNYLKKDGTLEKKAIELITNLRNGQYKKLSYFYASQTTKYPMILNSDLFIITSNKETIINEGFFPTTKAIVKINKENKYVEQTLKELEKQDIEELKKEKEAKELFEKMLCEAKTFIANNEKKIFFVSKTAFFHALKSC